MEKHLKKFLAAAAISIGLAVSASAASPAVENAKNNCIVGEQADGYLGVVTGANPSEEIRREIRDINQQRKAAYANLAQRNGVTIEVAASLTAEKLINQAGPGQCVRDQSGNWIKR
ncbi:MAG: YdbL family protein [Oricola sp.]|jgi:uncharacterized protein|nr:YdbL family protein [Oricola sp.]